MRYATPSKGGSSRVSKSMGRGVGKRASSASLGRNRPSGGSRLRTKRPMSRKLGRS